MLVGASRGSTTQTRNNPTSETATMLPIPAAVITRLARLSTNRTLARGFRLKVRPVQLRPAFLVVLVLMPLTASCCR